MANVINSAFHSLDNDDFVDLLRPSLSDSDSNNPNVSTDSYYNLIARNMNSSSDELDYNFDFNHDIPSAKYVTENQFKDVFRGFSKDTFALLHFNIRSINKHFEELQLLLNYHNKQTFPVIALTETWLSSNSTQPFTLNGYELFVNNRLNMMDGGVALDVPQCFEFTVYEELNVMNDSRESLFIEIPIPQNKNIVIGVIYRPPNSNPNEFLTYLSNLINNPLFVNKDSYIMGDFNLDLLKHANNHSSQEFLETFLSASFLPLISKPTRVVNHSATLIDNILCNTLPLPDSSIILSDITDHYPIMTHFNLKPLAKNNYPLPKRRRATLEILASLSASFDNADWSCVYDSNDVNLSFDNFLNVFNEHLDAHIPKQKDNRVNYKSSPRLPWISKSLLRSINRKNRLYYKYKMNKYQSSKDKYTSYKNTLTKILRLEKRKYYSNQLELYKHDMKNTWKVLKQAMNTSKKKSNINKIRFENQVADKPHNIANVFNTYFSTIEKTLLETYLTLTSIFLNS